MGYIREPKDIDLVVSPSILTEDTKNNIQQAIAQYKKTGKKPKSIEFSLPGSTKVSTHNRSNKSIQTKPARTIPRKAKI